MLVGLAEADDICRGGASVYGHSVKRDMDRIRRVTGVCTQQDLLLPQLSVYENILLFAQLKVNISSISFSLFFRFTSSIVLVTLIL
jgi:ABC-type multidrug transport system ATPase subunit